MHTGKLNVRSMIEKSVSCGHVEYHNRTQLGIEAQIELHMLSLVLQKVSLFADMMQATPREIAMSVPLGTSRDPEKPSGTPFS